MAAAHSAATAAADPILQYVAGLIVVALIHLVFSFTSLQYKEY